jgi:membrane protease subunit HflK
MDHDDMTFDLDRFRRPRVPKNIIKLIGIGLVVVVFLFTSIVTIGPEEVGVILRLGKFSRAMDPGLNFKLPFGIETVYKVPVERQLKLEFGFRTEESAERSQFSTRPFREESLMLTGDLNAAEVEWIVQFRIEDPYKFLFKVRDAQQTFRDMNEALMREIVGDRSVNEVLTVGRVEIANTVSKALQDLANQYETGIKVDQVVLQDVNPPDSVKPAFNEVNEAQQEREKLINQARSEYNRVIPKSRGDADRAIQEARGYAVRRVNEAQGDASKFESVFQEYQKAPDVTKQRIYLETMGRVLQKVGRKLVTDQNSTGILPLFDLKELQNENQ